MYTLQQRKLETADFAPSLLNEPDRKFYGQTSFGVDLALYEGGASSIAYEASQKMADSKFWAVKAQTLSEFSKVASEYAQLLVLLEEKAQLESLKSSVRSVLERYSIGTKSNPVGYSGLLGKELDEPDRRYFSRDPFARGI